MTKPQWGRIAEIGCIGHVRGVPGTFQTVRGDGCGFILRVQTRLDVRPAVSAAEHNRTPSQRCPVCGGDMAEQSSTAD